MQSAKRFIGILSVCVFLLANHGCSPYYAFGNSGIDPITFNKPLYADSTKVTTYLGGKFTQTLDSAYWQSGERNYFGQLYWAQTHIEENYNYSYGAFGYLGSYKVTDVANFKGNKSYYGGGMSGEINYNVPFKTCDIRFIGIKGTLFYEDGEFTRFRREASQQNLINGVFKSKFAYNLSLLQGVDFKLNNGKLGVDISNGISYFTNDRPEFFTSSMNIHYTYSRYTGFLQFTNSLLGIGEEISIGFNYRIK